MQLIVFLVFCVGVILCAVYECKHRDYGNEGTVCVCTSNYCDFIEPYSKEEAEDGYIMYTSNLAGERFKKRIGFFQEGSGDEDLQINREITYQKIIGFGGAFTDATGINIKSLDAGGQENLMRSYFSDDGIEYNLGRVPIGGTDFSTHGYSYLDSDDSNEQLEDFNLRKEDFLYKIPLIKHATSLRKGDFDLFASAWIAPKWMKTNGEYAGWSYLKEDYFQDWADYKIKFLDLYKKNDINFWAITTGNEPSLSLLPFNKIPSVGFLPGHKVTWVRDHFGPTLNKSQHSHLKVIGLDDQRMFTPILEEELKDEGMKRYINGVGIHWYWNKVAPIQFVDHLHKNHPDLFILGTEACRGQLPLEDPVSLGSWSRGEDYAYDIIVDLQHWMTGWVDWCMALDPQGGPTYIDNFVDSPIIVNATSGEFYKQPMYYALGHFSKFLKKDSIRLDLQMEYKKTQLIAFERPDKATVLIIFNSSNDEHTMKIQDGSKGMIQVDITPRSINSIVYW